jgi:hypothetical protein
LPLRKHDIESLAAIAPCPRNTALSSERASSKAGDSRLLCSDPYRLFGLERGRDLVFLVAIVHVKELKAVGHRVGSLLGRRRRLPWPGRSNWCIWLRTLVRVPLDLGTFVLPESLGLGSFTKQNEWKVKAYCRLIMQVRANMALCTEFVFM